MLGSAFRQKNPARAQTVARVETWTRARFTLAPEVVVSVAELACQVPGCPPIEVVIAFWEGETRYHFKIFKRLEDVEEADLPYAWLKPALEVAPDWLCDCC